MIHIDCSNIENELWNEDIQLFQQMDDHYQSENERCFFETMRQKMLTELAPCKK